MCERDSCKLQSNGNATEKTTATTTTKATNTTYTVEELNEEEEDLEKKTISLDEAKTEINSKDSIKVLFSGLNNKTQITNATAATAADRTTTKNSTTVKEQCKCHSYVKRKRKSNKQKLRKQHQLSKEIRLIIKKRWIDAQKTKRMKTIITSPSPPSSSETNVNMPQQQQQQHELMEHHNQYQEFCCFHQEQRQQQQQQRTEKYTKFQQEEEETILSMPMPTIMTPVLKSSVSHTSLDTDITAESHCSSGSSSSCSIGSSNTSNDSDSSSQHTRHTPTIGVNLRVTGQCSQGGRKYMEDYFSVAYQQSENAKDLEYAFIGIYDGHGGAEAATFAKEHLMMEIINQKLFWSDCDQDVLHAIREGYIATHYAMWRDQDKWPKTANGLPSTAGTTATVAFIRREKIYIGHVGDSGIVLGYQNEYENFWRAKQLTTDHKPESMPERSRIMRSGGKVIVKSGVPRVVWNRPRNAGHRGPIRRNTPVDEIPFLAVARSLGDLWSYNSARNEFIVSPDPDVKVVKINPKTFRCLIFGTDGLWNVVTPQEAVNTVYEKETFNRQQMQRDAECATDTAQWNNPSKGLVDKALRTWASKKMRADNTSVVTVILYPPNRDNVTATNCADCDRMATPVRVAEHVERSSYVKEEISYQEIVEKYLPPAEYRNFNYYEEDECFDQSAEARPSLDSIGWKFNRGSFTNLHNICNGNGNGMWNSSWTTHADWEVTDVVDKVHDRVGNVDMLRNIDENVASNDEENDEDDEDVDDDDVDETDEDLDEDVERHDSEADEEEDANIMPDSSSCQMQQQQCPKQQQMQSQSSLQHITLHYNNSHYGQNEISSSALLGSEDANASYSMQSYAESYNSLLHDSVGSNSSHQPLSYQSVSGNSMREIMLEHQLYQQECMAEKDGYSLTKLETRREQQRCSSAGVQTFKIFQQHQETGTPEGNCVKEQQIKRENAVKSEFSSDDDKDDGDDNIDNVDEENDSNDDIDDDDNDDNDVNDNIVDEETIEIDNLTAVTDMDSVDYAAEHKQRQEQHVYDWQDSFSRSSHKYVETYDSSTTTTTTASTIATQTATTTKPLELDSLLAQEREEEQQVALERLEMQKRSMTDVSTLTNTTDTHFASSQTIKAVEHSENLLYVLQNVETSQQTVTIESEHMLETEETFIEEYLDEDMAAALPLTPEQNSDELVDEINDDLAMIMPPAPVELMQMETEIDADVLTNFSPVQQAVDEHETAIEMEAEPELEENTFSVDLEVEQESESALIERLERIEVLQSPSVIKSTTPFNDALYTEHKRQRQQANIAQRQMHYPNIPNENRQMPLQLVNADGARISRHRHRQNNVGNTAGVIGNAARSNSTGSKTINRRELRSHNSCSVYDTNKRTLRTRNTLGKELKAKSSLTSTNAMKRSASMTQFLRTANVSLLSNVKTPTSSNANNVGSVGKTKFLSSAVSNSSNNNSRNNNMSTNSISTSAESTRRKVGKLTILTSHHQTPMPPVTPQQSVACNAINLRSRQVLNRCVATVSNNRNNSNGSNNTNNKTPPNNCRERRILRSGSSSIATIAPPLNYSKSTRLQSGGNTLAAPPPSPKLLNPTVVVAASTAAAAATRARSLFANPSVLAYSDKRNALRSGSGNNTSNNANGVNIGRVEAQMMTRSSRVTRKLKR